MQSDFREQVGVGDWTWTEWKSEGEGEHPRLCYWADHNYWQLGLSLAGDPWGSCVECILLSFKGTEEGESIHLLCPSLVKGCLTWAVNLLTYHSVHATKGPSAPHSHPTHRGGMRKMWSWLRQVLPGYFLMWLIPAATAWGKDGLRGRGKGFGIEVLRSNSVPGWARWKKQ